MKETDLIERAERGEIIGDGRDQIEELLASRDYCRELIRELQRQVLRLKEISVMLETQHRDKATVEALVAERAKLQAKGLAR